MLVSFKIVLNQFEISISIVIFSGFPKMIHKSLGIPTAVLFSFFLMRRCRFSGAIKSGEGRLQLMVYRVYNLLEKCRNPKSCSFTPASLSRPLSLLLYRFANVPYSCCQFNATERKMYLMDAAKYLELPVPGLNSEKGLLLNWKLYLRHTRCICISR